MCLVVIFLSHLFLFIPENLSSSEKSSTSFSSTFDPSKKQEQPPARGSFSATQAFKPAHKSSLSVSTPDINTQFASSNSNNPTFASNQLNGKPGSDFLKPKAPRGWDKSQGPDVGLFFPATGSAAASQPGFSQPASVSPHSGGSGGATAGFRPVQFKAPGGSKTGVFDTAPKSLSSMRGQGGFTDL